VKAAIPGVARGGLDAPRAGRITGSIRFLKRMDTETAAEVELHLIVDNYGTHKNPRVKSWLQEFTTL
jgi:hypothetical protein